VREDVREKIIQTIPVKRLGKAEEIGSIVGWLTTDDAAFTTGAEFSVNGGCTWVERSSLSRGHTAAPTKILLDSRPQTKKNPSSCELGLNLWYKANLIQRGGDCTVARAPRRLEICLATCDRSFR